MSSVLEKIRTYKLEDVARRKAQMPRAEVEALAAEAPKVRGFADALTARIKAGQYALIAEIKKASPSKGLIRTDFDPPQLAQAYEQGGAACLSVLTDAPSFQGDDGYLIAARAEVSLPVLRKDFMLDPYQITESRALGADCVLLILACLSDMQAAELEDAALALGMDVLVEVHTDGELERALQLKSPLIGINNRDLNTFETSLGTTETLAKRIPQGRDVVSESGLFTPADLTRMKQAGVMRFLIGESLMRQADVAAATKALLAREPATQRGDI